MNVLIIGGTGVLSSAVTNEALRQGFKVTMINRGNRSNLIPDSVEFLKSDKNDSEKIRHLLGERRFDAVIDFLCYSRQQLEYSFNLFCNRARQFIFISSCAVYDPTRCTSYHDEDAPKRNAVWKYSIEKSDCEDYLREVAGAYGINYTIIRPGVTYGGTRIPYGISPAYGYHWTLVERILNGKPIITWHRGENRVNITRVEDFAVGVVGILGNPKAYNQSFNIVGDETPSWKEVLDVLGELLGKEVRTIDIPPEYYAREVPSQKGEILGGRSRDGICSNSKIKSAVPEFKQTLPLNEGVRLTLNYYKQHHYIYGIDYAFDGETDRIIRKYCKKKGISVDDMNLGYMDYFNVRSCRDKWEYYRGFYRDKFFMRLFDFSFRVMRKVKRSIRQCCHS